VTIVCKAGDGGPGHVSFAPGEKSGPDGGNGGDGGDVLVTGTSDLTALSKFSSNPKVEAEHGVPGATSKRKGRYGKSITFKVPVGTTITDTKSGEPYEIVNTNEHILLCQGGEGGRGNFEFRSSTQTTPRFAEPGTPGQRRKLHLNLKLIAHFGLIGLPNAGKSSLLNELTGAHAKVGNYNFTTLEPNLGVFNKKIIADIPGLIEGASKGKGLGIKFLKHIEKVDLLLHCISVESEDPVRGYKTIRSELAAFNPELIKKKEVILLTKADMQSNEKVNAAARTLKKLGRNVITVSINQPVSLEKLGKVLV